MQAYARQGLAPFQCTPDTPGWQRRHSHWPAAAHTHSQSRREEEALRNCSAQLLAGRTDAPLQQVQEPRRSQIKEKGNLTTLLAAYKLMESELEI